MRPNHPDRRYPPTPYAPHSEDTRLYRDGWDDGWDHTMRRRRAWWIEEHYASLTGPRRHGYYDGVQAAIKRLTVMAEADKRQRRIDAAEQREKMRREAEDEPPY